MTLRYLLNHLSNQTRHRLLYIAGKNRDGRAIDALRRLLKNNPDRLTIKKLVVDEVLRLHSL